MRVFSFLTVFMVCASSYALDLCQFSEQSVTAAESQVNITPDLFSDPKCQGLHLYRLLRSAEYQIFVKYGEGAIADFEAHPVYQTISQAIKTIWKLDSLRNSPIPTNPKVIYQAVIERYSSGLEAYFKAGMDAELLRLGASWGTAEDATKYSLSYGIYQQRVKAALSAWESTGYKRQVEQIAQSM